MLGSLFRKLLTMSFEFSPIDHVWVLLCAGLVFLMQAGFLCLETGVTRTKNSINVAVKNISDFGVSVFVFWMLGFGLMFGPTLGGGIGGSLFFPDFTQSDPWLGTFFIFQATFCGTAVTIVSGAVAERMRFSVYLWLTLFVALVIYPMFGHWAWGGALVGEPGWLAKLGFIDFAGSTVVHSVGGWVALVAIAMIGPRQGRFLEDGKPRAIHGQNLPLAILGSLLLCFGWIGFNGGSALEMNGSVPHILANTFLGGITGLLSMMFVGWKWDGYTNPTYPMNGLIAGLVSITASCHMIASWQAVVIGGVAGLIAFALEKALLRVKFDDVVGAFPVHAGAGVWGTLAVGFFGDLSLVENANTRLEQIGIQGLGVVVCFLVVVIPTFLFLKFLSLWGGLRVDFKSEHDGLNVSEHNATTEYLDLLRDMEEQATSSDLNKRVRVEPFTEVGQIASKYNEVLQSLQVTIARDEMIVRDTRDAIVSCREDGRILSVNPGAEMMFELTEAELLRRNVLEFLECPSQSELLKRLAMDSGITLSAHLVSHRKNRLYVEIEGSTRLVSHHVVITLHIRNVTETLNYRKELTAAKEKAEAARDELQLKVNEVEAFNKIAVDRELRMIELKKKINQLCAELGREPPYLNGQHGEVAKQGSEK